MQEKLDLEFGKQKEPESKAPELDDYLKAVRQLKNPSFVEQYQKEKLPALKEGEKRDFKVLDKIANDTVVELIGDLPKYADSAVTKFAAKYGLGPDEMLIVLALYDEVAYWGRNEISGLSLLKLTPFDGAKVIAENMKYLEDDGRLLSNFIVLRKPEAGFGMICASVTEAKYSITDPAMKLLAGVKLKAKKVKKIDPLADIKKMIKTPKQIFEELSKTVIGQDSAKKTIAVAAFNHYKRVLSGESARNIGKSNIMLIGPTGCGKTMLCRALADIMKVPMITVNATDYTENGYVGQNVEEMLALLLRKANGNLALAEKGMIYIDEIDKIAAQDSSVGHNTTRDVSGRSVQEELLKLLESNVVRQNERTFPGRNTTPPFNTRDVLFIVGGAFVGLDKVPNRFREVAIGFNRLDPAGAPAAKNITTEDLVEYGMLPELLGRIPVLAELDALTTGQLVSILENPVSGLIKEYTDMFALSKVKLEIEETVLCKVAELALVKNLGARGLRKMMEALLRDKMYELFDLSENEKCLVVTPEMVEKICA